MTSAYSTTSLPTSTMANLPNPQTDNLQNQRPTKFIWKEPPTAIPVNSNDPDEQNRGENATVKSKQGGSGYKRKDLHHVRRHTLQGGVDVSMVSIGRWPMMSLVVNKGQLSQVV